MKKVGYVYIMGNSKPVIYIGVTSNLAKRVNDHKENIIEGFTKRYNCHKLLYYESFDDMGSAIEREKQLKNWKREWKLDLIKGLNIKFEDLSRDLSS
jgi:putative endonuclease